MGVTGTWEGWVPTATDLYLRGNNIAAWVSPNSSATFESGGIMVRRRSTLTIETAKSYNLTPYTKLNVLFKVIDWGIVSTWQDVSLTAYKGFGTAAKDRIGYSEKSKLSQAVNVEYTITLDISGVNYTTQGIRIELIGYYTDSDGSSRQTSWSAYIFRIWLS